MLITASTHVHQWLCTLITSVPGGLTVQVLQIDHTLRLPAPILTKQSVRGRPRASER